VVFPVSAALVILFVTLTLVFRDQAAVTFGQLRIWVTTQFDWFFIVSANLFVVFLLLIAVSPLGRIRLGGKGARPEYRYPAWLAMLFAAGVGIGLMFFGVLEPVTHTLAPPLGVNPTDTATASAAGMSGAIFHWGLHAWACYVVVGLALAYFAYNRGMPLALRSAFEPLFGERVNGGLGNVVDILAVLATLFGLATSLGFGTDQIGAGLNYLLGIEPGNLLRVVTIGVIMAVALASVLAGLDRGIKRLSILNMVLAATLLLFVLVAGPTMQLLGGIGQNTMDYLRYLPALSNWMGRDDTAFMHDWTTFYWAWWIAWSPFVGMFMARVSYGRSVREFITWALIMPSLICIVWMSVFGGTALDQLLVQGNTSVAESVPELAMFKMLEQLPLTALASGLSVVLVAIFFITSADSGALVVDTLASGGRTDTHIIQRAFWCLLGGLVAIALLLGGGHGSLQALCLSAGLPFTVVLLLMCVSLLKGLIQDAQ
jgi:BCCT family betaine/carnitine transporter